MNEELINNAVEVTKQREGLLNNTQDKYIKSIVKGIIRELEKQNGIEADLADEDMFMFVVYFASYRYSNRDSREGIPLHLRDMLRNMYINSKNDVEG